MKAITVNGVTFQAGETATTATGGTPPPQLPRPRLLEDPAQAIVDRIGDAFREVRQILTVHSGRIAELEATVQVLKNDLQTTVRVMAKMNDALVKQEKLDQAGERGDNAKQP